MASLKRNQTAQSKSPAPGWRSKQLETAGMSRLNNSSTSFSKGDGTTASMADDVTADGTHSTFETMDPDHDYGTPPSFRPSSTSGDGDASGSNHNSHYQQHQHQQRNNNNNAAHFNRARSTTVMESRAGTPFSQQSARERSETVRPQSDKPRSNNTTTTSHSGLNNNNTHYDGQSTVQEYDENDQAAEMDITNKIVLCITSFNGKIGCCYYDPMAMKLYLIEDQTDSSKFDMALNIIDQVSPHITLVSNRADEQLVEGIKKKLSEARGDFVPTVEIRANREFQASQGRTYLLDLPLMTGDTGNEDDEDAEFHRRRDEESRMNRDRSETEEEVVNVGQEGLRKAYDFMRMRRRRIAPRRGHLGRFVSALRLGGSVTLDSEKSLETVACLFSYLNRKRNAGELAGERKGLEVVSIELISLKKTMLVNTDTLCSLQIFETEDHANIHSSNKKEGLSVFSMLNTTKTGLGRSVLKRWLLQPSTESEVLNDRYNAVECFARSENIHISENIQKIITVKNVPRLLKNLIAGHVPVQQWQALAQFLSACISVRDLIGNLMGGKDVAILQKLCDSFEIGLFAELNEMIESKIDWTESREHHRVCILEGVDKRLDDNRRTYHGLPSMLSKIAQHISKDIDADFCQSLNVIYFPQLGYLCAVPLPDVFPNPTMDAATPPGWQFQFSTEISIYYKNQEMRDLDTHVGDLHGFIVDREVELVQEMLEHVLQVQETLCDVADVLAELDVLLAFADAARTYDWTRPVITDSNVIRITQGIHPLVMQCVDNFVPNDGHLVGGRGVTRARLEEIQNKPDPKALREAARAAEKMEAINSAIANGVAREDAVALAEELMNTKYKKKIVTIKTEEGETKTIELEEAQDEEDDEMEEDLLSPDDSVLILTGANASGKSVFLKTVAIIVYMAHIGSFVPAEKAVIGLTDKIMTRVTTRESVSRGTSAFMIDLQQVSLMLRNCTERSLLLIDEFGKGTNSIDGASLFVGLIKHLVTKGPRLPKTILATHFHEIFFNDFLKRGLPIGLAHMELVIDREQPVTRDPKDEGKVIGVTPLFKLAPGLCLKSYAFHCAESFGIPTNIVERALKISTAISSYNVHEIMDPEMTEDDEKELVEAEQIVRRLLLVDWDADDEDGNPVSAMKKLADVLGEDYIDEVDEAVPVRRQRD